MIIHHKALPVCAAIAILSFLIISCNNSDQNGIPVQANKQEDADKKHIGLTNVFNAAVAVDSTSYLMYPLALGFSEKKEGKIKSYSSDRSGESYWNIAFYDSITGNSSLLDTQRVMRINSFQKLKSLLLYKVIINDHNGNGVLDYKDPSYLFTSDLNGKNFRQITPDGMECDFQTVANSDVILIQAVTDSNKDKEFGEGDDRIQMIFDAKKATSAKATFSTEFHTKVNQIFNKLYKN